ncbi:hypothetical protein TURU_036894 [Turdus rufiventris]|nr:hypothetical protein TURU_036894 [Turdus rufiventris]
MRCLCSHSPITAQAISEATSPGTAVLRLSASDTDELGSPNSEVRYALEGNVAALALLRIDAWSSTINTRVRLDLELLAVFELCMVAQDGRDPPCAATCRLSVCVEDANDNEPRFERAVYCSHLPEHATPGFDVLIVQIFQGHSYDVMCVDITQGALNFESVTMLP